jgi:hypothetical protein
MSTEPLIKYAVEYPQEHTEKSIKEQIKEEIKEIDILGKRELAYKEYIEKHPKLIYTLTQTFEYGCFHLINNPYETSFSRTINSFHDRNGFEMAYLDRYLDTIRIEEMFTPSELERLGSITLRVMHWSKEGKGWFLHVKRTLSPGCCIS